MIYQVYFSIDCENWSVWENYSELKLFTLPSGDGEKTVYFKVSDKAGNIAEPVSTTILLNTKSLEPEKNPIKISSSLMIFWYVLILIIIILFLIIYGLIILIKRKKRVVQELLLPKAAIDKPVAISGTTTISEQIPATLAPAQLLPVPTPASVSKQLPQLPPASTPTTPTEQPTPQVSTIEATTAPQVKRPDDSVSPQILNIPGQPYVIPKKPDEDEK